MHIVHPWATEGLGKVRFGVGFFDSDWAQLCYLAQVADELGFDSLWVPDHPTILPDSWTTLAALAVITRRLRLGTLVSCIFYRHPVLLARMVADVDRLSGGRLILGLGIGDFPFEFARLGLPFLSTRERQQALEETIQIVRGVWGTTPFTYQGKYMQARQTNLPFGPVQQPHIPLLIAGGGERVTLRMVAQYADASNFGPHADTGSVSRAEDVVRKYTVLRAHCEESQRPMDSIVRTHITLPLVLGETPAAITAKLEAIPSSLREQFASGTVAVTPQEAVAYYKALTQAGINYFIIWIGPGDEETLHMFSQQVAPAFTS